MIKTKCIFDPPCKNDGTRICVMRYVKPFYKYDEWSIILSPSEFLLNMYRRLDITWDTFERMYKKEMENADKQSLIKGLRERSLKGEIITLLCWEKEDTKCHRRLLKELIEKEDCPMERLVRITYCGDAGTRYSELDVFDKKDLPSGEWINPFDGTSPVIGLIESLLQSDNCPPRFHNESICRVIVEDEKKGYGCIIKS
jgi:uncharacterized protein YeaO (DUF488 family)